MHGPNAGRYVHLDVTFVFLTDLAAIDVLLVLRVGAFADVNRIIITTVVCLERTASEVKGSEVDVLKRIGEITIRDLARRLSHGFHVMPSTPTGTLIAGADF